LPESEEVLETIERFLTAIGVSLACPICKTTEFNIDRGAEIQVPMAINAATNCLEPQKDQSAYVLHCARCGFVIPFMRTIVDRSPKTGPKPELEP
jgi:hypothetical protein